MATPWPLPSSREALGGGSAVSLANVSEEGTYLVGAKNDRKLAIVLPLKQHHRVVDGRLKVRLLGIDHQSDL